MLPGPTEFFWRATASVLRRSGKTLSTVSDWAYWRSRPSLPATERKLIEANVSFRNCHAGKRCFIVGNGPSIKNQDLSRLKNEITFVMNGFWKHEVIQEWQTTHYFLADAVFFDRSAQSRQFFENVRDRVYRTTFFAPLTQRTVIVEEGLLPLELTRFYAPLGRYIDEVDDEKHFDLTHQVPDVLSVAQIALLAAIYMGCSPIYLMGQDYDWLSHHGEGAFYFFPGLTLTNHPGAAGKLDSYDREMESMLKVWKGYRKLSAAAEQRGIQILNATHGGFLDVFE